MLPVRLPKLGRGGQGWHGSQKQLSKYRLASFLFLHGSALSDTRSKLRQAQVLNTTLLCPLLLLTLSTALVFLLTQHLNRDQFMNYASSSNKNHLCSFQSSYRYKGFT